MNVFKRTYCRIFQKTMYLAVGAMRFREPTLIKGSGSVKKIAPLLNGKRVLIVSTPSIVKYGLLEPMLDSFRAKGIEFFVFDKIVPNPTFSAIYECRDFAISNKTNAIVAVGGGSALDTAKAVICLLTSSDQDLNHYKGMLKCKKKYPLFIAIPTTAGSGSEVTVASVVTNEKTGDKFAISDPKLIPDYAVLDPNLMVNLPKHVIATTGMDALTHAVESYIGHSNYKKTRIYAQTSVALIAENLLDFYQNPKNTQAALNMQYASYLAGLAFTKSYVGYVHALAHSLGGKYNVPHGEANAILLPFVLQSYGKKAAKSLQKLDSIINLRQKNSTLCASEHFIEWIKGLNAKMSIVNRMAEIIKVEDLDELARHADKEANPLYPVPKELDKEQLKAIYLEVIK
ncbi:MAG: iron-containing alcohol dehydrogenase [Bacilli bacterium]|nr:iron-containing alcohol dehydrogenase [Bacilli bacterium]